MKSMQPAVAPPFARAAVVFIIAVFLASAPAARAHARLVRANPARNAQLAAAPGLVELWFNELLDDGFNTLEVYPVAELVAEHHGNLATDKPAVDPADRTHLSVKIPPLQPGEYVVEWRVLSRDGHSAPGRLIFRILKAG